MFGATGHFEPPSHPLTVLLTRANKRTNEWNVGQVVRPAPNWRSSRHDDCQINIYIYSRTKFPVYIVNNTQQQTEYLIIYIYSRRCIINDKNNPELFYLQFAESCSSIHALSRKQEKQQSIRNTRWHRGAAVEELAGQKTPEKKHFNCLKSWEESRAGPSERTSF